jgi:hypothetical protein
MPPGPPRPLLLYPFLWSLRYNQITRSYTLLSPLWVVSILWAILSPTLMERGVAGISDSQSCRLGPCGRASGYKAERELVLPSMGWTTYRLRPLQGQILIMKSSAVISSWMWSECNLFLALLGRALVPTSVLGTQNFFSLDFWQAHKGWAVFKKGKERPHLSPLFCWPSNSGNKVSFFF